MKMDKTYHCMALHLCMFLSNGPPAVKKKKIIKWKTDQIPFLSVQTTKKQKSIKLSSLSSQFSFVFFQERIWLFFFNVKHKGKTSKCRRISAQDCCCSCCIPTTAKEAQAEEQPFQNLGRKMEKSNIFKEKKATLWICKGTTHDTGTA